MERKGTHEKYEQPINISVTQLFVIRMGGDGSVDVKHEFKRTGEDRGLRELGIQEILRK